MHKKINKQKGYTIIETMIAISLFLIIVMAGMGALLNANLLHQKSRDMRSILDNMSYVMEDMSKNLRTGYNYHCLTGAVNLSNPSVPISCASGWGIFFEGAYGDPNDDNDQWIYSISGGKIYKKTQGPYAVAASSFTQMTPDEVVIDPAASSFSVVGAEPPTTGDHHQPFVTIKLVGTVTYHGVVTPFSLQTSVSQRLIDI